MQVKMNWRQVDLEQCWEYSEAFGLDFYRVTLMFAYEKTYDETLAMISTAELPSELLLFWAKKVEIPGHDRFNRDMGSFNLSSNFGLKSEEAVRALEESFKSTQVSFEFVSSSLKKLLPSLSITYTDV